MSGPYQGRDLSNCGVGRLRVAINCGVLSVKAPKCTEKAALFKENNFRTYKHRLLKKPRGLSSTYRSTAWLLTYR